MSDQGSGEVTVEPARRHRWLRRELWFVGGGVALVLAVLLVMRRQAPTHVAPGAPIGGVPAAAVAVPAPRAPSAGGG